MRRLAGPLPPGVSFVSGPDGCGAAGGVVRCAVGELAAGAVLARTFVVHAGRAAAGRTLTNGATVSGDQPEGDPSDNQATADVTVGRLVDLTVAKTASEATPAPGEDVGYLITVANAGPSPATDVAVTDLLPPGLELRSVTTTQGACAGTACAVGVLPAGAAVQVLVDARVVAPAGALVTNAADATAAEPDADPADNRAAEAVTVLGEGGSASLRVTNTASRARAVVGDVRVTDTSAGATAVVLSARPSQGSCTRRAPVTCRLGSLAAGGRATVRLRVRTTETGALRNTATAGTEQAVARTRVRAGRARLTVRKRAPRRPVAAGGLVRYRLSVRNRGPATALRVRLCDRLPRALSLASAGTCRTFPALRTRAGRAFTVRARILRAGRIRNHAAARARNAPRARTAATIRARP